MQRLHLHVYRCRNSDVVLFSTFVNEDYGFDVTNLKQRHGAILLMDRAHNFAMWAQDPL